MSEKTKSLIGSTLVLLFTIGFIGYVAYQTYEAIKKVNGMMQVEEYRLFNIEKCLRP